MLLPQAIPSIQSLKNVAKQLARTKNINLGQALQCIANDYGFTHWTSMLKYFKSIRINNIESLWKSFIPGEMLLLSAREGAGKLSLALNLAAYAIKNKVPVNYFSMHVKASFIFERLEKIADQNLVKTWQLREYLMVEERSFDQQKLIEEIKNSKPGALLIIDYLQVIKSFNDSKPPYQDFLKKIKFTAQQHNSRVLILSQVINKSSTNFMDYIDGGRSIGRHFSHVIHLEHQQIENIEQRDLFLIKSVHYQKQESMLQFNKGNYRFE